jgi:excisionase family DNA binding protein
MSNGKQLLTIQEAADFLHISTSHLYKLTAQNKIKHYQPGGKKIYFLLDDLLDYVKAGKVKTTAELEAEAADHMAVN